MIDRPTTREEAMAYRYGQWAGDPRGRAYLTAHCAAEVSDGHLFTQCSRNKGHGPSQLYCKQHAKKLFPEQVP